MTKRFPLLVVAAIVSMAAPAQGQAWRAPQKSLPAFQSDSELTQFLRAGIEDDIRKRQAVRSCASNAKIVSHVKGSGGNALIRGTVRVATAVAQGAAISIRGLTIAAGSSSDSSGVFSIRSVG